MDVDIMPQVTSVVPGILVPVDRDITQPFNAPRNRIERAKSMLESIEFHRQGGIQGILHLADMERKRILQESRRWEAMHDLKDAPPAWSPAEADLMIASMNAPAVPGINYDTEKAEMELLNFRRSVDTGDRKDSVRQLQRVMEDAISQLHGYDHHMEDIRKRWVESLEKEERLMEARFGPAEDASTTTIAPTMSRRSDDEDITMG